MKGIILLVEINVKVIIMQIVVAILVHLCVLVKNSVISQDVIEDKKVRMD